MTGPANDDDDLVYMELDCSFDELLAALEMGGAEVQRGLLTDDSGFIVQAND